MKLNLGCGEKKMEGDINVDLCGTPDVQVDLSLFPWPFEDDSAEEISSSHFLEHVQDYERTILEMHRILKPNGVLHFKVPHFRNPFAQWHLHKWGFSVVTCGFLCLKVPCQWNGIQLFEQTSLRISYIFIGKRLGRILGYFANISPVKWDWLGLPIDEIEFFGRKV